VVLHGVCEAVKEKVDSEEEEAPRGACLCALLFAGGGGVVQSEYCHPRRDGGDDSVLVEGVGSFEDCQVQEHYGEELAGFGQDEGDVVDVFQ